MVKLEDLTPKKVKSMNKGDLLSLVEDHELSVTDPGDLNKGDLVDAVLAAIDFGPEESPEVDEGLRLYVHPACSKWVSRSRGDPQFIVARREVLVTGVLAPSQEIYDWLLGLTNPKGIHLFQKERPVKKAGATSGVTMSSLSS